MNRFIRVMVATVVLIAGIVNAPPQIIRAEPNLPPVPTQPPTDVSPVYPDMRMQMQPPPVSRFEITALITETNTLLTNPTIDMKVLVIHGNGFTDTLGLEHPYTTLKSYLDILGIPHDTVDLSEGETIDEAKLWDGVNHGHYYAIFFTTNSDWYPGLSSETQEIIAAYERNFGVRQVTLYAYPYPEQSGLTPSTPGINGPMTLTLTSAGQSIFSYLQPDIQITMDETIYGYPAISAGDADVTPLIVDENSDIAMAIFRPGDGREHLVFTWSSYYRAVPPNNIHARLLPYGIINWATKGIFLGERHVYFIPQPDDVFFSGDGWNSATQEIIEGEVHRLETTDLDNLVTWMDDLRTNTPNAADFKMEMPFNGEGTEQDREYPLGDVIPGTLTARAIELKDEFIWLNHTYTHVDLNPPANETTAHNTIKDNNDLAVFLTLTNYTTRTLLTGAYSGLTNPNVINAAYNLGIQYMLVDASDAPTYTNPSPNTGIAHTLNPEILLVPRHANNIFYFAVTPQDETEYYNIRYPGEPLNYEEIIDVITNQSLENLLDFNVNPTMFHMNNVIAYNTPTQTNTLLRYLIKKTGESRRSPGILQMQSLRRLSDQFG